MSINLQKTEQQLVDEVMGKVNLSKDKEKLGKSVVNLSKCIVNLSKKANVDIGATKAQVVFVIDRSGSMDRRYSSGVVQKIVDKMVPLGLTFDDDGSIVCMQFNSKVNMCDDITLENYENYVNECMQSPYSGTNYSPALKEIKRQFFEEGGTKVKKKQGFFSKLFGKKSKEEAPVESVKTADVNECPVFVLFVTDGGCDMSDERATDAIVRELSNNMCFIQFLGSSDYSSEDFRYLKSLDDLSGREFDNTGFVRFDDIEHVSDEELYNIMLEKYAEWLKAKGF